METKPVFLTAYANAHQVAKATPFAEAENLHSLFAKQPLEQLGAGQSLFFEGDEAKHVFEIVEGTFRLFRILGDGRRVITGFLYAGDIVGISMKDCYLYSVEAIASAKIRRLSRRAFQCAVAESEILSALVFEHLCDEMASAQDQMVLLSCKSAEERLCTFLLRHMNRTKADGAGRFVIEIPMPRQDMADYLGLTIETVSRTITKLIGKGVLTVVDPAARHFIKVDKPAALAQLAGDGDECIDMRRDHAVSGGRRRH
ncbi:Crp/Fnr family transcriptional regulator (plasmid) [Neorhizobium sp. SOG26]|uniref:Helix-turn-helix domain-containing protein n=1 Tax=Neorhizobium turbinariae TaxID=2937795 RepID=A0ABT0IN77_9HYPH|nr:MULTISPECIES: helix-turn-helix domain-containing protein [Neorhizobium]AXV17993.1 Crp/Fnr family transcriptional regulator [Neorhizobium sp. SOG26]MCK8779330.1 helix-turn-helix domain-containing protein [Neorhizobium turbinariae]